MHTCPKCTSTKPLQPTFTFDRRENKIPIYVCIDCGFKANGEDVRPNEDPCVFCGEKNHLSYLQALIVVHEGRTVTVKLCPDCKRESAADRELTYAD